MIDGLSHLSKMSGLEESTKAVLEIFQKSTVKIVNLLTSMGEISEDCCPLGTTLIFSVSKMHLMELLLDLNDIGNGGVGRRQPGHGHGNNGSGPRGDGGDGTGGDGYERIRFRGRGRDSGRGSLNGASRVVSTRDSTSGVPEAETNGDVPIVAEIKRILSSKTGEYTSKTEEYTKTGEYTWQDLMEQIEKVRLLEVTLGATL